MPKKTKAEPWEGDSSDDWEPEETDDGNDLLVSLDGPQLKKKEGEEAPTKPSDAVDENGTSRKRGRGREKKKKIEFQEIEKPRGIDRGLLPERILAAQLFNNNVQFLVKWVDCEDLDVVPGKDLNLYCPDFVMRYYESCMPFSVRHKVGKIPRIAPELPPEPEPEPEPPAPVEPEVPVAPQATDDVSAALELPTLPGVEDLPDMPVVQPDLPSSLDEQPAEPPQLNLPEPTDALNTEDIPAISLPMTNIPDMSLPDLDLPEEPQAQEMELPVQ